MEEQTIRSLPVEILIRIFSFFDANDLSESSLVCRHWEELSNTPILWRSLCLKKQKGAAELIAYRLSLGETSKKRKREETWKQMYLHYSFFSWFLDGNCSPNLLGELELAISQQWQNAQSNCPSNPSELVWLHSVVFTCAQDARSVQPLYHLYQEAVVRHDAVFVQSLIDEKEPLSLLEKVVRGWKCRERFLDLLFTFFRPVEKKRDCFPDGMTLQYFSRQNFIKCVWGPLKDKILSLAQELSTSSTVQVQDTLSEVHKIFLTFGEPFLSESKWTPLVRIHSEQTPQVIPPKPLRRARWFVSSDDMMFMSSELVLMSPVLQDIINKQ